MADFNPPSFLENQGVDEIHARMMMNLPEDMDVSEGGHPWNLTMPAAYEKAYMAEFIIMEAIKLIFPAFSEDYPEIMDFHAQTRGLKRKQAEHAIGEIVVTAEPGVEIPTGTMFSTIGVNEQPAIDFLTTVDVIVDASGKVTIPIQAMMEGTIGNVPENTIVLNSSEIDGITVVNNPLPTTGGLEEETTEDLQERINEFDKSAPYSYGGAEADYRRWALAVSGVGGVVVIQPSDDTTPIQLIITATDGSPATDELCQDVFNHIMRPDDPELRLAPVNDQLMVVPPASVDMLITATVELTEDGTIEYAKTLFIEGLKQYVIEALEAGEIRMTKIGAVLSDVAVVADYTELTLNGGTSNVPINDQQIPSINPANIILTAGTV